MVGNRGYLVSAIIALTFGSIAHAAEAPLNPRLRINWSCDSSKSVNITPNEKSWEFPNDKQIDFTAIDQFLNDLLTRHPKFDLSECIRDLSLFVYSHCDGETKTEFDDMPSKEQQALHKRCEAETVQRKEELALGLNARAAKYLTAAKANNPVSRFVAADSNELDDSHYQNILNSLRLDMTDRDYCMSTSSQELLPRYLDKRVMTETLPKLMQGPPKPEKECVGSLGRKYARLIKSTLPTDAQCKESPADCKFRREKAGEAFKLLGAAGIGPYTPDSTIEGLDANGCVTDYEIFDQETSNFIKGMKGEMNCVDLKPGEESNIKGNIGTGLNDPAYHLKRTGENDYEATLDIAFVADDTFSSGTGSKHELEARQRLQSCIAESNKYLSSPDGKQLKLKLAPDSNAKDRPMVHKVALSKKIDRANSGHWSSETSCGTMIHELGHLMGLVDEYPEHEIGRIMKPGGTIHKVENNAQLSDFDCRAIGPADSLMHNHQEAIRVTKEQKVRVCKCHGNANTNEKTKACVSDVYNMSPQQTTCPPSALAIAESPWDLPADSYNSKGKTTGYNTFQRVIGKPRGLLYPAQLSAILNPGCVGRNKTFFTCSQEAYKTSGAHKGPDKCNDKIPTDCKKKGSSSWLQN